MHCILYSKLDYLSSKSVSKYAGFLMKRQFVRKCFYKYILIGIEAWESFLPRLKNTRYFLGKCRFKKKYQTIYFTNQNELSLFVLFAKRVKKIVKTWVALHIEQEM